MPEEYVMTQEELDKFISDQLDKIIKDLEDALDDAMRTHTLATDAVREAYKSAIAIVKKLK
jgi:hypothetical protein